MFLLVSFSGYKYFYNLYKSYVFIYPSMLRRYHSQSIHQK